MNSVLQRIAVYCSASDGVPEVYNTAAYRLGQLLAQEGVEVVYGDGGIGLMKHLAEGVLAEGGRITGVIPRFMVEQGWNNPYRAWKRKSHPKPCPKNSRRGRKTMIIPEEKI